MNNESLCQFLIDSNNAGYASGDEKKWIKESDGSTTIPFEKGAWKSHDNFFGGEPYGGRTVVFYENRPYWIMVYYGWVKESIETTPIYKILRNALKQMPKDYPFRGPKEFKDGEYAYSNSWEGKINRFSGEEQITQGERLVYRANYIGGLVDVKKGV
ncbi:DUF5680 domain-containing protein [Candidatus Parcubacteria bacterium]|nr:hypothetical protein [Patescibacteria group bacterium]MBU4380602.1 hypothetical protein [Patescibacteria group bacterium]MCG2689530.1 DUF5680 domain-containing protein [Candidatus Parcubacteria bacterium]